MEQCLRILLADDDADDRYFFKEIMKDSPIKNKVITVVNGEKLMLYLIKTINNLPHILFLDINMPCKNGLECLTEIKRDNKLMNIPVIILTTSKPYDLLVNDLYEGGAHYFVQKISIEDLRNNLHFLIQHLINEEFKRPNKELFVFEYSTCKLSY